MYGSPKVLHPTSEQRQILALSCFFLKLNLHRLQWKCACHCYNSLLPQLLKASVLLWNVLLWIMKSGLLRGLGCHVSLGAATSFWWTLAKISWSAPYSAFDTKTNKAGEWTILRFSCNSCKRLCTVSHVVRKPISSRNFVSQLFRSLFDDHQFVWCKVITSLCNGFLLFWFKIYFGTISCCDFFSN